MTKLREVMRAKGLTFEQVASEAGVALKTVYNAADGKNPNRSTKRLIAQAVGETVEAVFPAAEKYHGSRSEECEAVA